MEFDAEFKFAKSQNSHVEGEGGHSHNLMLSSNLLKSKIPILRVGGSWNLMPSSNLLKSKIPMLRVGGLTEFDAEFKFAKIQNSHVEGGGGLTEFDAEFKFAKIQIPMLRVGMGGSWNSMLSPNLL